MRHLLFSLTIIFTVAGNLIFPQDTLVFNRSFIPPANKTLVFTPKNCKAPEKGYPLLYLLHGWDGCSFDWNNHISIQEFADKYCFVIVCPDGYIDSWYVDSPIKKENQFRTFFSKDLVPQIHNKYRIDSSEIFITGLSMGGQGAINIFLDNQEYFRSAASMSGILNITAFPGKWGIPAQLGEYSAFPENWEKYSCVNNLKKLKNKKVLILIDCGTEDFAYPVNIEFKKKAEELGVNLRFIERKGSHTWDYWTTSLPIHLDFFKSQLKENIK